jgi:hypothetical protein
MFFCCWCRKHHESLAVTSTDSMIGICPGCADELYEKIQQFRLDRTAKWYEQRKRENGGQDLWKNS